MFVRHSTFRFPALPIEQVKNRAPAFLRFLFGLAQRLAFLSKHLSLLPVHLVPVFLHALQIIADLHQEFLCVGRSQQPLADHALDQLGLLREHQRGGLLGADLGHGVGIHRI